MLFHGIPYKPYLSYSTYNRLEDYLEPLDILETLPYFKTIVMQKDSEFTELFNRNILKMQGRE